MNIKEIRAITGLTQSKFAEKYGLNKRTLQNWEGGANRPPQGFEKLLLRAVMEDQEREPEPATKKDTISRTGNTNGKITENKKLMSEIFKTVLEYLDDSDLCCTDCIYRKSPEECNKTEECVIQLWEHYDDLLKVIRELTNTEKAVDYVPF